MKHPDDSRTADKFVIRLKPGQRHRLQDLALTQNQSMNEVAISALERYFDQQRHIEVLLNALVQASIRVQSQDAISLLRELNQAPNEASIYTCLDRVDAFLRTLTITQSQ